MSTGSPLTTVSELTASEISANGAVIEFALTSGANWSSNIADVSGNIYTNLYPALISCLTADNGSTWGDLLNTATFKLTTNDTITMTIPKPSQNYNIQSNQTITFKPPISMMQDLNATCDPQTFAITADQAALSDTLTSGATGADIIFGGKKLSIKLTNCLWNDGYFTSPTTSAEAIDEIFSGITVSSSSSESSQWDNVKTALKSATNPIQFPDPSTLTITLPAVHNFDISAPITITLNKIDESLLTDTAGTTSYTVPLVNIPNNSFTIKPDASPANTISWTSSAPILEESKIKSTFTLKMILSDNSWTDFDSNTARKSILLNSFTPSTDTVAWNNLKTAIVKNSSFGLSSTTNSNDTLTITGSLPTDLDYNILTDQTVTVNIPTTVLTNNYPLSNTLSFTITANPSVTVSGSLTSGINELDIINGKKTIQATLYNATWDPAVTTDLTKREKLINCLLPSSDTTSWTNPLNTIKAGAKFSLNNNTVIIELPSVPDFNINTSLNISPLSTTALITDFQSLITPSASGALDISSTPFTISPINNQSASLKGTALTATEPDIVAGNKTLAITLNNDIWAQTVVQQVVNTSGFITIGTTPITLDSSNVVRKSDTELDIALPPVPNFNANGSDQTVKVSIPSGFTSTNTSAIDAGSFTIKAVTAALSGSATTPLDSTSIKNGGKTIVITLNNATWSSNVVTAARIGDLRSCFSSTPNSNWTQISNAITASNITLTSKNVLTIKLPPIPSFGWTDDSEQVTFEINGIVDHYIYTKLMNESLSPSNIITASNKVLIGQSAQAVTAGITPLSLTVSDVQNGGKQIVITLSNGNWDPNLPKYSSKIMTLVNKLVPNTDSTSWAKVQSAITKATPATTFVISSAADTNDTLTINLPAVSDYDPINNQTITLTILPKSLLATQVSADIIPTGQITVNLSSSSYTNRGSLQSMLADSSFANYINTVPIDHIILDIPLKHLTSVNCSQTSIADSTKTTVTTVSSFDCYTDSNVTSVNITFNGLTHSSPTFVSYGTRRKFSLGFATVSTSTSSSGSSTSTSSSNDAKITVLDNNGNTLQKTVVLKASKSKTYSLAPTPDLSGSYSLKKLMTNSTLLTTILKYYVPEDITVKTP